MIKKIIIFLFVFAITTTSSKTFAENSSCNDEISNRYFAFTMPCETKGTYIVNKQNNAIDIIEKTSAKLGEGGFAFGFKIFKSPADYANLEGYRKIGELTDNKGILYDMTLARPVENICADDEKSIENFLRLYDSATDIEIKGVNGSTYHKNQGMKGENLYKYVLNKYKQAISENQEDFTGVSPLLTSKKSSLKKLGYAFYDINSDGIDELFIGEIKKSNGTIYDIYTMINRKPVHVLSRYYKEMKYFVCNDSYLCEESRISKDKTTFIVRTLDKNSVKRPLVVAYLYNKRLNKENPWFRTYKLVDNPFESISKETYEQGVTNFDDYKKFNYIPFE